MDNWPNFFLVGAQKAGTSSIYAYLKQHPDIFLPAVKEPHFFSQVVATPSYQPIFFPSILKETEYLQLYGRAGGFRAVGDASVSYLWDSHAPRRIWARVPDAKILIVLRDPVERAYSHYLMNVREGVEVLPFYEALLANQCEISSGWGTSRLYIETGLYAAQVERYVELFGRERIQILLFEDLKTNPSCLVRQVAEFLCVDPVPMQTVRTEEIHNPHLEHRNRVAAAIMRNRLAHTLARQFIPREMRAWIRYRFILQPGPKPRPDPRAIAMLRALYEPDLQNLERILARPFPCLRMVK